MYRIRDGVMTVRGSVGWSSMGPALLGVVGLPAERFPVVIAFWNAALKRASGAKQLCSTAAGLPNQWRDRSKIGVSTDWWRCADILPA